MRKRFRRKMKAAAVGTIAAFSGLALGAAAYLTASDALVNKFTGGANTSKIREKYTPPEIEEGKDADISKEVVVTNTDTGDSAVACYVRAAVNFTTSDLGTYAIEGMDDHWVDGEDGYYYYTRPLDPGESTEPLMTSIHIDGTSAHIDATALTDSLDIIVTEESYQARDPKTDEVLTWEEAWKEALGGNLK